MPKISIYKAKYVRYRRLFYFFSPDYHLTLLLQQDTSTWCHFRCMIELLHTCTGHEDNATKIDLQFWIFSTLPTFSRFPPSAISVYHHVVTVTHKEHDKDSVVVLLPLGNLHEVFVTTLHDGAKTKLKMKKMVVF